MRRICRSYLVFTGFGYRLVMFGLVPLFLLGIQTAAVFLGWNLSIILPLMMAGIETMADSWFLGGIQSKDAEKMDFLKTSAEGMRVMKTALIMDFLRRFVSMTVVFLLCCGIARLGGGKASAIPHAWIIALLMFPLLFGYTFSVLATLVGRFSGFFWINMLLAYPIPILGGVSMYLILSDPVYMNMAALFDIALAALGSLLVVVAVRTAMKKVEGSYYDVTVQPDREGTSNPACRDMTD